MKKKMSLRFSTPEWRIVDEYEVADAFIDVGFRRVKDVVELRLFDLLNISRINNNRAEEMLLCIYHLLQPDRRVDECMLSHPKDTHWYPVFYVMANTGMRVGEITGLRWSDIDLKKGIIRVNHTLVYYNHRDEKGCYFSINTPKTKAGEREIPMTEGVKQAFLMEREFQSQAEISSKSRVDGYDDFIFVNRYGDVQNQGNLNKALRRMMRDCNDEILEKYGADSDPVLLPQFSCHILRHTFATRLCESGANLKFIQSILGHADVSTTMNIYVDVTDALKKKEITAFDDYMTTKLET